MKFTYASGQKPVDGYEVKRGIGRGGFGEVYFGLSEGGKEVALKLIQDNHDIELRGVGQCLNLKHPNLVHLYDLKTDVKGDRWLVMEYVAGESLAAILAKHPQGVGPEDLACAWFAGLAGAIHHLHDHGIVHRDLKPANIFLESGAIKVGDYGLCKFIGGSQRLGQTQSVGTVHYMAPEISTGNYNRQVDVYSAGIILYEMLTGQVPFDGETAGEILMKHLTTPPDLSKVPSAFVPILDQALCKNPAHRFQTIAEMAKKVAAIVEHKAAPAEIERNGLSLTRSHGEMSAKPPSEVEARSAWLELGGSLALALLLSVVMSIGWGLITKPSAWQGMAATGLLTMLCAAAILIPGKIWSARADESWQRRLTLMGLGLLIGGAGVWFDGFEMPWSAGMQADALNPWNGPADSRPHPFFGLLYEENRTLPVLAGYLGYFGLMFLALRWWKLTERHRPVRFSMQPVLAVGFWAYVLLFLLPAAAQRQEAFGALVLTAVIVQIVSPWQEPTPQRTKRLRLRHV